MTLPNHFLVALEELGRGVYEIAGPASNGRIDGYLASVGQPGNDEIAWCSAFVNWCIEAAGGVGTGKPNARSWLNWGKALDVPTIGCIAIFKRGAGWQGHVGFVLDVHGGLVTILGGNQSNRISVTHMTEADLLGYRTAA